MQKLVDKINAILLKIFAMAKSIVKKNTPKKLTDFQNDLRKKKEEKKNQIIEKASVLKKKVVKVTDKTKKDFKDLKRISSKKVRQTNEWVENFSFKNINFKQLFNSFFLFFLTPTKKIISLLSKIPREKAKFLIIGTTFFLVIALIGYQSLNEIVKTKTGKDIISFEKEKKKIPKTSDHIKRPDYFLGERKQFSLQNIDLPIYVEDVNAIRMLTFDFTVEGTNRYIAAFFSLRVNENLIKNQLNGSVEPIVPSFPLEEEGKRIIKLKLKEEINNLVKKLKIQGSISKVYIDNVLAN